MLIGLLMLGSTSAQADWLVKRLQTSQGAPGQCVVESTPLPVYDGYQETQAFIIVSTDSILVKTRAPLDDSFGDIGLQVEKHGFIKLDRLVEGRSALFVSSYARLLEQLKQGPAPGKKGQKPVPPNVRVQLRFWPTWPATGAHTTEFPLDGFRKAYAEMLACQ